jgi:hypothetical protein
MRKALLASLLLSLAAASALAQQLWYDPVSEYPVGGLTTNTALWFPHLPGTLTATDLLVVSNSYTSGAAANGKRIRVNDLTEYAMRLFDTNYPAINTNPATLLTYPEGDGTLLYLSFIANANYVDAAGQGTYFICLNNLDTNQPAQTITNGFEFRGRIFQIGNTNVYPFTTTVASTFQYGVANALGDPAQGGSNYAFVPFDLLKNIDVQVVLKYDIDNATAYLYVNPAQGDEFNSAAYAIAFDNGPVTDALGGVLLRQRTGGGTVDINNIAVGLSFADVVTNVAATSPVLVATNYQVITNYAGNPALLEVFPTSIGGGTLSYQWYQKATPNDIAVGGNSQTYLVSSLAAANSGYYYCAVTNSSGVQGAHSTTNFHIGVNTTSTAPSFTSKPPAATNGTVGGTLVLAAAATGTGPLTYAWTYNGSPLTDTQPVTANAGDSSVVSGSQTPTLTVNFISTNETGLYAVTVTGGYGSPASTSVAVTVNPAKVVTIAYLRSLESLATGWQVTDTADIFTVSNAVCTIYTNVTSGTTASYYVQDASGCGLNLFVTGDATFRPQMGDLVSFSGTLSMYDNNLETDITSGAPYQFYGVTGHTNVLPAPVVFSLAYTNNPGLMETNFEGTLVMLTNVYFTYSAATYPSGYGTGIGNDNLYVTNANNGSIPFNIYLPGAIDTTLNGYTLPRFAYTITGVLVQYNSSKTYTAAGYEVDVTRIGDIVTTPPPPVTNLTASVSGNNVVLNWTPVPYTIATPGAYSYSVWSSTNVAGPYLPLATGMAFNTPAASYTHTNALLLGTQRFYQIVSP